MYLILGQAMSAEQLSRGERIEHVRKALGSLVKGGLNQAAFGILVAKEEGRLKGPYNTSTVSRWEQAEDSSPPDITAIEAMVRLARRRGFLYVSRAWLAFGIEGVVEAVAAPSVPQIAMSAIDDGAAMLTDMPSDQSSTQGLTTGTTVSQERPKGKSHRRERVEQTFDAIERAASDGPRKKAASPRREAKKRG
jgi:hypothetical protein